MNMGLKVANKDSAEFKAFIAQKRKQGLVSLSEFVQRIGISTHAAKVLLENAGWVSIIDLDTIVIEPESEGLLINQVYDSSDPLEMSMVVTFFTEKGLATIGYIAQSESMNNDITELLNEVSNVPVEPQQPTAPEDNTGFDLMINGFLGVNKEDMSSQFNAFVKECSADGSHSLRAVAARIGVDVNKLGTFIANEEWMAADSKARRNNLICSYWFEYRTDISNFNQQMTFITEKGVAWLNLHFNGVPIGEPEEPAAAPEMVAQATGVTDFTMCLSLSQLYDESAPSDEYKLSDAFATALLTSVERQLKFSNDVTDFGKDIVVNIILSDVDAVKHKILKDEKPVLH